MTSSEQNGIDILCDAAGSDMLLSSLFSLAAPDQQGQPPQPQGQQQQAQTTSPGQDATPQMQESTRAPKRKLSDDTASAHVCHICKRVYERADHLTRHLRSHENARPYQCSRCPKRFNRADLLTRHETTHDRYDNTKDRPFIKRSDRAAEACLNCAASKAKCEDQKPCSRCRSKNLTCEMPERRFSHFRTSDVPVEASNKASQVGADSPMGSTIDSVDEPRTPNTYTNLSSWFPTDTTSGSFFGNNAVATLSDMGQVADEVVASEPLPGLPQGLGFALKHFWQANPKPQAASILPKSPEEKPDMSYAFRRSPWVFDPHGIPDVDSKSQASSSAHNAVDGSATEQTDRLTIPPHRRDHLIFLIGMYYDRLENGLITDVPSLEGMNTLLQTHFAYERYRHDEFIHEATFTTHDVSLELLWAMVASGASHTSNAAFWKRGLGFDSIAHFSVMQRLQNAVSTRGPRLDLSAIWAALVHLHVAQWSGLVSKMHQAEGVASFLIRILRTIHRTFLYPSSTEGSQPQATDAADVLQRKWKNFVAMESYKRCMIRLFLHDIEASIILGRAPLMSFSELDFELPASRDLWKAKTATEWSAKWLAVNSNAPVQELPKLKAILANFVITGEKKNRVDYELCYDAVLHGFWKLVSNHGDVLLLYVEDVTQRLPEWLEDQFRDLINRLGVFLHRVEGPNSTRSKLVAELILMLLDTAYVNTQPSNADQAQEDSADLPNSSWWVARSRHAAWHAGQVLRYARRVHPASLQGFNAIAVYMAIQTLVSLASLPGSGLTSSDEPPTFFIDGEVTEACNKFMLEGTGNPGFTFTGDPSEGVEPLSNTKMLVAVAEKILRDNFPAKSEEDGMPPLVRSLRYLLQRLRGGFTEADL